MMQLIFALHAVASSFSPGPSFPPDHHYRYMMRLITRKTKLYTEMVVDATVNHTPDLARFMYSHPVQHPVALQLGGSNPEALARAAAVAHTFEYDEINLNCGCPSSRVAVRGPLSYRLFAAAPQPVFPPPPLRYRVVPSPSPSPFAVCRVPSLSPSLSPCCGQSCDVPCSPPSPLLPSPRARAASAPS